MATLTVQTSSSIGALINWTGAGPTGDKFVNTGHELLLIRNIGESSQTATIDTPGTLDGLAIAQRTFSVEDSGAIGVIGPFDKAVYNDGSGFVNFAMDDQTNILVAVIRRG